MQAKHFVSGNRQFLRNHKCIEKEFFSSPHMVRNDIHRMEYANTWLENVQNIKE